MFEVWKLIQNLFSIGHGIDLALSMWLTSGHQSNLYISFLNKRFRYIHFSCILKNRHKNELGSLKKISMEILLISAGVIFPVAFIHKLIPTDQSKALKIPTEIQNINLACKCIWFLYLYLVFNFCYLNSFNSIIA